jgi:hypothetical protein
MMQSRTIGVGDRYGLRADPEELVARNEYLAAENRILKTQRKGRLKLSDAERATLGEIGNRLGRRALTEVATMERWVRSVKEECLCKVILLGERSLRQALNKFVEHYHAERNHQGKCNVLLFPRDTDVRREAIFRGAQQ